MQADPTELLGILLETFPKSQTDSSANLLFGFAQDADEYAMDQAIPRMEVGVCTLDSPCYFKIPFCRTKRDRRT